MNVQVSLFSGRIRPLPASGRPSGIYKQALTSTVVVDTNGFVGDEQADLRVHGGPEKAIHLYPASHYARLAAAFPECAAALVAGSMGENISTPGLDEHQVRIGDIWRLGSARLQVCQPRNPCWKIDDKFNTDGMAAYIAEHRLTGWYWRVLTPGVAAPGDTLELETAAAAPTLAEAMDLASAHRPAQAALQALADLPGLASQWRDKIINRLAWLKTHAADSST
jgi:MOSC domain-containing protein YiiM